MFAQWSRSLNGSGGLGGRAWWDQQASGLVVPVLIKALADKPPVAPILSQWCPY